MNLYLKIKKLSSKAIVPEYAHPGEDAGLDLHALESGNIPPGQVKLVRTGIAIELPPGHEGQIRPRSGLATKHNVTVANAPGTVDPGYRGELMVALVNHASSVSPFAYKAGDRIAQLVISPVAQVATVVMEELSDTVRGQGGFGSTGVERRLPDGV